MLTTHRLIFLILIASLSSFGFAYDIKLEEALDQKTTTQATSDIHGFFDLVFKNDYITPRGLLVTNTGVTIQILAGLVLDIYKNPCGFVNDVSIVSAVWNDLWSEQNNATVGCWNEFDWNAGVNVTFANDWKLLAQFVQFLSPPGNFKSEQNAEFILTYDDTKWHLPVVFNPYAKLFWAISGDSTVVVGKPGGTYYVEFGMIPTLDLTRSNIHLILTAPTWISVGPANFWNGGDLALKNVRNHFGVFSTSLIGKIPLKFISKRLGSWYFDAGVQYYYLINKNLLQAQKFTIGVDSLSDAHRNVVVAIAGIGFTF